jgi:hypothetical protein
MERTFRLLRARLFVAWLPIRENPRFIRGCISSLRFLRECRG